MQLTPGHPEAACGIAGRLLRYAAWPRALLCLAPRQAEQQPELPLLITAPLTAASMIHYDLRVTLQIYDILQ